MSKRKFLVFTVIFSIIFTFATGCKSSDSSGEKDKISVVCTIFPQYDWVKQIIGDKASKYDLTLLLDNGVDLHNYQPTADDIVKISNCDLFIYVGGESDGWVDDVLASADNKDIVSLNMVAILGDSIKEEETVEGMEKHEHEHDSDEQDNNGDSEEELEYDEHVWLSLKNASELCDEICSSICSIDKDNESTYKSNAGNYIKELDDLDSQYQEMVDTAKFDTILFGDRFPFRYMVDDYGLNYYAAFAGCSAETEASFNTIVFLAGKVDELKLPAILKIEGSDGKIADTILSNTSEKNQKILTMNSLQSVTKEDVENGENYLNVMAENLEVLKEALN